MIPIRDHNPSQRTPYITWGLMALNIVIFFSYWSFLDEPRRLYFFYQDWALVPQTVLNGQYLHTLITYMFLHGGFMHLAGNMLFLWIFGDNLEDELGHLKFLLFYILAGIGAAVVQIAADPSSNIPIVGASGAIAGVMGGYLLLFPKAKIDILFIFIVFFKIFPIPAWITLGIWFGLQLLNGIISDANSGVAYWAHAGGFIVGALVMLPAWINRGGRDFWEKTHGHPDHPETRYSRSTIPIISRRKK
ncbi:rhomboid family intramembrane serine protease [Cochlodiniinecator piscidefendens]|uniref:rhomboid family intramembrane serine protease n=1 Tax=Cochlodiniinecator piscidefendens TaxID=2715756 RepID=UPI00140AF87D|nr:rhomboid family intramembrane serine protease [Cochlodiniinecator piscidefendens]